VTITVVGLGPAGPEHVSDATRRALAGAAVRFARTDVHTTRIADVADGPYDTFDAIYDTADSLDDVYAQIVDRLIDAEHVHGDVVYAVPGSPMVAERTVELLRTRRADIDVQPALSFLDLAWARLGVDPFAAGVRLVDAHRFAVEAAGERGPLLVGQTDTRDVLSEIKLSVDDGDAIVTVLHHLGLADEQVVDVAWDALDRSIDADHLTSLWIPVLATPVARALMAFDEVVHRLRIECPWDAAQTHQSLAPYAIEESYELVEAIDELASSGDESADEIGDDAHLVEELGDVLFQVMFHSVLGEERGSFSVADVADTVREKLIRRHPHVFGDVVVADADEVVANWQAIKAAERNTVTTSALDGVSGAQPSLSHAAQIQRRASKVGFDWPTVQEAFPKIAEELVELRLAMEMGVRAHIDDELGDLLFAVVNVARHLDVDPETALRTASAKFARRFRAVEELAATEGIDLTDAGLATLDALWDRVKARESS
jgi:tetrapyrrole methylase family protein / MazG family protein